jgi:hypothetical protein
MAAARAKKLKIAGFTMSGSAFRSGWIAIGATMMLAVFGAGTTGADAQNRTIIDLLFGDPKPAPQIQEVPKRRSTEPRSRTQRKPAKVVKRARSAPARQQTGESQVNAAAPEPPTEKLENAHVVLVVGDFIANGLAEGLEEAFAEVQSVIISKQVNGSSGLVRDDFYDWPAEIGPMLEEIKPSIVVVMLGSNDRQAMRVDGRTEKVRTDAWQKEYVSRVNRFAAQVKSTNTLLVWTGGPPFRFKSMSADILAFNEIYRQATDEAGGYFVDIWDGFVDQDGAFVTTGSDINGQTVRLRNSDGINFTNDGKRKIAFYVERQLRQLLGDAASPLLTTLAPESLSTMRLPPLQTEVEIVRSNPIPVSDPELDGGAVLLGDINAPEAQIRDNPLQSKPLRARLVEDGIPAPVQPGQANDFSWPAEDG